MAHRYEAHKKKHRETPTGFDSTQVFSISVRNVPSIKSINLKIGWILTTFDTRNIQYTISGREWPISSRRKQHQMQKSRRSGALWTRGKLIAIESDTVHHVIRYDKSLNLEVFQVGELVNFNVFIYSLVLVFTETPELKEHGTGSLFCLLDLLEGDVVFVLLFCRCCLHVSLCIA